MSALAQSFEAAGGGLSLVLIVAITGTMVALAFVYLGAAIVVLGRFAQAVRRPRWVLLSGLLASASLAAILVRVQLPEASLAPWGEWGRAWGLRLVGLLPLCALAMGACRLLLSRVSSGWLVGLLLGGVAIALALVGWPGGSDVIGGGLLQLLVAGLALGLVPLAVGGLLELRAGVEWFIAVRYLVAQRRQVFISAITLICVGGVAAGVWLIIVVLSVMNGFERTWRDEIVGNYAHFIVGSEFGQIAGHEAPLERIRASHGVVAASPYLQAEGMVRVASGRIVPVRLRGIDPMAVSRVTKLADKVVAGSLDSLNVHTRAGEPAADGPPGLLLGRVMATRIGVDVGDTIVLIAPFGGAPTPMGTAPRLVRFRVTGLFASSFLQYDELYAYANLYAVQAFLGVADVVDGFEVRSVDFYRSRRVAAEVARQLGYPFYSRDWKDLFPQFFHALRDNRSLMFMLLVMIMVVAAFVIVVTLMMMIMAKSADIAILKTMGASDESIERIFAIEGTLIGLAGVTLGVLAGVAVTTRLAWIQERIEEITGVDTLPASIYQISTLPSEVDPLQVTGVVSIALILSLGATLLPSRHGARLDPVEALRHD